MRRITVGAKNWRFENARGVVLSFQDHIASEDRIFTRGVLPLVLQEVNLLEEPLLMMLELSLHDGPASTENLGPRPFLSVETSLEHVPNLIAHGWLIQFRRRNACLNPNKANAKPRISRQWDLLQWP